MNKIAPLVTADIPLRYNAVDSSLRKCNMKVLGVISTQSRPTFAFECKHVCF